MKYSFNIDYYKVLKDDPNLMLLEAYIVSEKENRHDTYFTIESIQDASQTLANKPIICIWNESAKDFKGHAYTDGEMRYQDAVGCIPETNYAEVVDYMGKKFQKCVIAIWKHYYPHVAQKLASDGGAKISMEIESLKEYERPDGLFEIQKFRYLGITLIGMNYTEAIPNAKVKVIKYTAPEYADEVNQCNLNLKTFTVPQSVKDNAKNALELDQKNPKLVEFANTLVDSDSLDYQTITWMFAKMNNIRKKKNISFYGGKEARDWCKNIILQFEAEDDEEVIDNVVNDEEPKKTFAEESIKIDNSKESAMDSQSWDDPGASLYNKLKEASNAQALINEAYLLPGDNATESKYPHHSIRDGELVINIKGLQAAGSRLNQTKSEGKISDSDYDKAKSHLERHRKELELPKLEQFSDEPIIENSDESQNKKGKEVYSLDIMDLWNLLEKQIMKKGKDEYGIDMMYLYGMVPKDNYAVAYIVDEDKYVKIPYAEMENGVSMDMEGMKEVYPMMNYVEMGDMKKMADMDMDGMMDNMMKMAGMEDMDEAMKDMMKGMMEGMMMQMADMSNMKMAGKDAMKSMYSVAKENHNTASAKTIEYNDMVTKYAKLEEETSTLRKYHTDMEKERKQEFANKLYEEFDKYITDEEKEDFNSKLFTFTTLDDFAKEVKSQMVPKIVADLDALKNNPSGGTGIQANFTAFQEPQQPDKKPMTMAERLKQEYNL